MKYAHVSTIPHLPSLLPIGFLFMFFFFQSNDDGLFDNDINACTNMLLQYDYHARITTKEAIMNLTIEKTQ